MKSISNMLALLLFAGSETARTRRILESLDRFYTNVINVHLGKFWWSPCVNRACGITLA
jgi:hypothetical protein